MAARREHTDDYRQKAADMATELLTSRSVFKNSQYIACYIATRSEFNLDPIIQACWEQKKQVYLPIILNEQQPVMSFVRYRNGEKLIENDFGVLEPHRREDLIEPDALDVAVVPLVAFDRMGQRLGMGGGFYDRLFAFKQGLKKTKPFLLGAAFANQESDIIPADPWDVTLDGVLTEREFIHF